jgi:hypothetical protein
MLDHFKERSIALQTIEYGGGWDARDDDGPMRGKFPFRESQTVALYAFPSRFHEKTRSTSLFLWLGAIQQCPKVCGIPVQRTKTPYLD